MATYATRDDLVASDFVPSTMTVPDDPEATRLLARASRRIDSLLITALYDTDDQDLPTDVAAAAALRDATCAQVAWWLQTGDESGAQAQYQSVQIGSVSLTRGYTSGASATGTSQVISEEAVRVLHQAGLLLQGPVTY